LNDIYSCVRFSDFKRVRFEIRKVHIPSRQRKAPFSFLTHKTPIRVRLLPVDLISGSLKVERLVLWIFRKEKASYSFAFSFPICDARGNLLVSESKVPLIRLHQVPTVNIFLISCLFGPRKPREPGDTKQSDGLVPQGQSRCRRKSIHRVQRQSRIKFILIRIPLYQ
jgi:hypothetical protein